MTFNGLMVYRVTVDGGFEALGGIAHPLEAPDPDDVDAWSGTATCSSWWSRGTTPVKRSVFMEDFAYSVADGLVQVAGIGALDDVLQSIYLP